MNDVARKRHKFGFLCRGSTWKVVLHMQPPSTDMSSRSENSKINIMGRGPGRRIMTVVTLCVTLLVQNKIIWKHPYYIKKGEYPALSFNPCPLGQFTFWARRAHLHIGWGNCPSCDIYPECGSHTQDMYESISLLTCRDTGGLTCVRGGMHLCEVNLNTNSAMRANATI